MSKLNDTINKIAEFIKNYESKSFSSSNLLTKDQQSRLIAEKIVGDWVSDNLDLANLFDSLDGKVLSDIYNKLF